MHLYAKFSRYTIIDEADELLLSDWEEDLNKIMSGGGRKATPNQFALANRCRC